VSYGTKNANSARKFVHKLCRDGGLVELLFSDCTQLTLGNLERISGDSRGRRYVRSEIVYPRI